MYLKKVQNKVEKAEAIALLVNRGVVMDKTIDYTEDGIPVRVLYVSQTRHHRPAPITQVSLNEYFSKFGIVERVHIITKNAEGTSYRKPFSFAFVQFADPKVASR